jgi:hypothetical protein
MLASFKAFCPKGARNRDVQARINTGSLASFAWLPTSIECFWNLGRSPKNIQNGMCPILNRRSGADPLTSLPFLEVQKSEAVASSRALRAEGMATESDDIGTDVLL